MIRIIRESSPDQNIKSSSLCSHNCTSDQLCLAPFSSSRHAIVRSARFTSQYQNHHAIVNDITISETSLAPTATVGIASIFFFFYLFGYCIVWLLWMSIVWLIHLFGEICWDSCILFSPTFTNREDNRYVKFHPTHRFQTISAPVMMDNSTSVDQMQDLNALNYHSSFRFELMSRARKYRTLVEQSFELEIYDSVELDPRPEKVRIFQSYVFDLRRSIRYHNFTTLVVYNLLGATEVCQKIVDTLTLENWNVHFQVSSRRHL